MGPRRPSHGWSSRFTVVGVIGFTGALGTVGAGLGCASAPPRVAVVTLAPPRDEAGEMRAFDEAERGALDRIAAIDPRFAKRTGRPPSEEALHAAVVKALAAGDEDVAVEDGAIDVFSFGARARGLDEASAVVAKAPRLTGDAPVAGVASIRPKLERELLERLLAEEHARLEEERDLPRGASALLRGILETWTPPASPEAAKDRDAWLGRRLDQVRGSLAGAQMSRAALFELDDALDPLERLADPADLPSAAKAIASLRVTLGETNPASTATAEIRWARLQGGLRAHLGVALDAKALRARLEAAERDLRALAKTAAGGLDDRVLSKRAEALTFAPGVCNEAGNASAPGSHVRTLAPPPERAAICGALHAFHDASDDVARAAAAIALHDETVIALWALAVHGPDGDGLLPDRAATIAHLYYGAEPDREARLVRMAEARPVAAIGAGLAAGLLVQGNRSERWLAFGDAPLDVIEREVLAGK